MSCACRDTEARSYCANGRLVRKRCTSLHRSVSPWVGAALARSVAHEDRCTCQGARCECREWTKAVARESPSRDRGRLPRAAVAHVCRRSARSDRAIPRVRERHPRPLGRRRSDHPSCVCGVCTGRCSRDPERPCLASPEVVPDRDRGRATSRAGTDRAGSGRSAACARRARGRFDVPVGTDAPAAVHQAPAVRPDRSLVALARSSRECAPVRGDL
jgi:hypothetical protein